MGPRTIRFNPGSATDWLCTLGWCNLCVSQFLHVFRWVKMALTPWVSVRAQCLRLFAAGGDLESISPLRKTAASVQGPSQARTCSPRPFSSPPWGWSLGRVLQPLFCQQASPSTSPLGGTVGAVGGRTFLRPQAAEAGHPAFYAGVRLLGRGGVSPLWWVLCLRLTQCRGHRGVGASYPSGEGLWQALRISEWFLTSICSPASSQGSCRA